MIHEIKKRFRIALRERNMMQSFSKIILDSNQVIAKIYDTYCYPDEYFNTVILRP